tara:strand:+ start:4545 stop:4814 length:270 start_codon:yes stop_codon:yes gene_type:complete
MYGKKRIVINKRNQIVLAGKREDSTGGSWNPIGVAVKNGNTVKAKFLKTEFRFQSKLTDDNCILIERPTMKEVREEIKKEYAEELGISI